MNVQRSATEPFGHGGFNFRKLRCVQRAEFANRASDRIRGDALRDKRALFQEWNLNFDLKLRAAKRSGVKHNGYDGAISIGKRNAENKNWPHFSDNTAIEQPDFAAPRRHVPPDEALLPARRLQ